MPPNAPEEKPMSRNTPVFEAQQHGQSIWLDNISRDLLLSGELRHWVEHEGIRGVTSNPSIFEKAIAKGSDYDPSARALIAQGAGDALDVFEQLAVTDIQLGCDVLRPVWEESDGRDGFVSLEVSPHLAKDTEGTIAEARRLAEAVQRDNLMIKVPATPEGIPAIQALIAEGIHVNVTLLFAIDAYEAVHRAYLSGLETRLARGQSVAGIASVASFFISRIDAAVGLQIEMRLEQETCEDRRRRLKALNAKVAIANAKLAYARFLETLASERWAKLAAAGADPQRVLWASTATKDPSLPKTLYVDELIGRHTVNTLPHTTLAAFRKEGTVRDALGSDPERLQTEARAILLEVDSLGIPLKEITDRLLEKGCGLFSDAFDALLLSVETKRQQLLGNALSQTSYALGEAAGDVEASQESWQQQGLSRKLWQRKAAIFSGNDEADWMGWLDLPQASAEEVIGDATLREALCQHPADTVVVIGMGGSSLWPEVLGRSFSGASRTDSVTDDRKVRTLVVLDSTIPESVESSLRDLDLTRCLFFVSSKSGSTIESRAIFHLVYTRLVELVGEENAGRHFIAITDRGSALESLAQEKGFLGTALGCENVAGRFSALSPFGLLPAEAIGLDPKRLLARARTMSAACAPFVSPERNPGVGLGLTLATLARRGRDKLTLSASPEIAAFLGWVSQLIAESTGKGGQGIIPIVGESLGAPARYADDRVFVDINVASDETTVDRQTRLRALEEAGHPVVRIEIAEVADLVQEVFRWEMTTAVAGAVLGLNPFDQPDVEAAKIASRTFMNRTDGRGLPQTRPSDLEIDGARILVGSALGGDQTNPEAIIETLLDSLEDSDTFVINAFLEDTTQTRLALQSMREAIGAARRVATTLNFGPRYLHSTGQLQKGGPNRLVGLQLWQRAAAYKNTPLAIPSLGGDFGALAEAQAEGDFFVLCERDRRMVGIDVGPEPAALISKLTTWVNGALD
jgi:transaldolase/glucose-6-phosphate isomerase